MEAVPLGSSSHPEAPHTYWDSASDKVSYVCLSLAGHLSDRLRERFVGGLVSRHHSARQELSALRSSRGHQLTDTVVVLKAEYEALTEGCSKALEGLHVRSVPTTLEAADSRNACAHELCQRLLGQPVPDPPGDNHARKRFEWRHTRLFGTVSRSSRSSAPTRAAARGPDWADGFHR